MSQLAFLLPVSVIGELLGVPEPDRAQFHPLVRAVTPALEAWATLDQVTTAHEASMAMTGYFDGLLAERGRRPQGDLLTELVRAEVEGHRLNHDELIAISALLFIAGFETTANLIGNGLLALLRNPQQLQRLRDDPDLIPSAVEELLRFDSPVQLNARMALEPVEIGGKDIEPGRFVLVLIGAGNRDPSKFTDPDVLDVGRDEGSPLSFGIGIRHCLGAALARLEAQVVFERLLSRFSHIELCDERPQRHDTFTMRGLEHLPVRLTPRA
jgi:cytochrome P450